MSKGTLFGGDFMGGGNFYGENVQGISGKNWSGRDHLGFTVTVTHITIPIPINF